MRSLHTATKTSPRSLQLEKACVQQQRPVQLIYVYRHTHTHTHTHTCIDTHVHVFKKTVNTSKYCVDMPGTILDIGGYTSQQDRKISRLSCKLTEIYGIISAGAKYYVENKTGERSKMDWTSYFRLCDWKHSSGKCYLNEI